jgi:hypothetical protein
MPASEARIRRAINKVFGAGDQDGRPTGHGLETAWVAA